MGNSYVVVTPSTVPLKMIISVIPSYLIAVGALYVPKMKERPRVALLKLAPEVIEPSLAVMVPVIVLTFPGSVYARRNKDASLPSWTVLSVPALLKWNTNCDAWTSSLDNREKSFPAAVFPVKVLTKDI